MTEQGGASGRPHSPLVVNLQPGQDTGGQGIRFKLAFDAHSDWRYTSVTASVNYIRYPVDVRWDNETVERLWQEADVVHLRTWIRPFIRFDRRWPKPIVMNHHGTAFRDHHAITNTQATLVGAVQVCSTVDLLQYADDLTWLPAPYDLAWLAAMRPKRRRPGPIRVAHAPTNRAIKGTGHIIEAVERVAARHKVEFDLIEQASWQDCLARKARADIFIDQLELGYGNNAVEAWGMGIPVVAGVTDGWTRAKMLELWGDLPFVDTPVSDLEETLERLVTSAEARREAAARGLAHAERFHDAATVVRQAEGIYARAIAQRSSHRVLTRMSRGTPYRPKRTERVEIRPGVWRFMRPDVVA